MLIKVKTKKKWKIKQKDRSSPGAYQYKPKWPQISTIKFKVAKQIIKGMQLAKVLPNKMMIVFKQKKETDVNKLEETMSYK